MTLIRIVSKPRFFGGAVGKYEICAVVLPVLMLAAFWKENPKEINLFAECALLCIFPLKNRAKYSILVSLYSGPSVWDKAALVGELAVPCCLQSATAGMNSHPRSELCCLTHISGDEESVPRNEIPRTMSGGEPSSIKWIFSCAAGTPLPSWLYGFRA